MCIEAGYVDLIPLCLSAIIYQEPCFSNSVTALSIFASLFV